MKHPLSLAFLASAAILAPTQVQSQTRASGTAGKPVSLPAQAQAQAPASVVSYNTSTLPAQTQSALPSSVAGTKIPDQYICVFKTGTVGRGAEQTEAATAARAAGGTVNLVFTTAIKGFSARLSATAAARLPLSNKNISYCEQDQTATLIPIRIEGRGSSGSTAVQPAQVTPWGVVRVGGGISGSSATAWVIDTGIDPSHPDLVVDKLRSKSFISGTTYADENGHGTHVAGIIAAVNNSIGVVGVAPGTRVAAVRVLDKSGSGSISGVIAGVDYVAKTGAPGDVANMSLGGGVSSSLDTAVTNAAALGIRFAVAAGNNGLFAGNYSPARVNAPNVYTVSAFGSGDTFASFSNYGNPPIDFAEPGVSIKSTWLGGTYNTISGTSMATPHLAGLLLLGPVSSGGQVYNDPDGNPDTIGVR